jgi:hypothetical protein
MGIPVGVLLTPRTSKALWTWDPELRAETHQGAEGGVETEGEVMVLAAEGCRFGGDVLSTPRDPNVDG